MSVYYKQAYKGRVTRRKVGTGDAITQIVELAAHVTITIPAGKGGNLIEVAITNKSDLTTVVCSGGRVRIRNSSTDWVPFESFIRTETELASGMTVAKPFRIPCSKYLPGNSSVYIDFTPYNALSQYLEVELKWLLGVKPKTETFSICTPLADWEYADKDATTGRIDWGPMAIPGAKGGSIYMLQAMYYCVMATTVIGNGALVEFENDAFDAIPTQFHTMVAQVVTPGAGSWEPDCVEHSDINPANSTWRCFGTSNGATTGSEYTLGCCVFWKRPYTG